MKFDIAFEHLSQFLTVDIFSAVVIECFEPYFRIVTFIEASKYVRTNRLRKLPVKWVFF